MQLNVGRTALQPSRPTIPRLEPMETQWDGAIAVCFFVEIINPQATVDHKSERSRRGIHQRHGLYLSRYSRSSSM